MTIWTIIPVKALRESKSRLSRILTSRDRAALTEKLLRRTLQLANDCPALARTLVVSRDPAVHKIARRHDALTFGEAENKDLDGALARAAQLAAAQSARGVLILPADLPLLAPEDLDALLQDVAGVGHAFGQHPRQMVISPDEQEQGTNALLVTPPAGFRFQYGPGSYARHLAEARRLGLAIRVVRTPGLQCDLDTEADWRRYAARRALPTAL